ncbi:LuxR C-terminal-related transcriptional regulator [Streptomyces sp. Act143]|uniref:helix-turn-helix transcriptional regulator n=1 Tax=Streptomyces sp. Act143 TaxID=2200760 RepID=UPI00215A0E74|nr:LuxR C-terminal-related transcriptional regulator [Streptomyces sp. Act143]
MVTPVNPPSLSPTSPPPVTDAWQDLVPALPEGVRVRLLHAVHGDPRAAAEAVRRLGDRRSTGLDPLPADPAELAPALLRAHRAEIRPLPDDTRLLLLLAAADQYPVATHAFPRAVAAARLDTRPLEAAEAAGLAHASADGVVFRDAWTRIAAYETGSPGDRRDVHRLLARVLRTEDETPLRSWHRGAGALGPSARLAAELATAATRARDEGRLVLAAALAERAAVLCPDRAEQARLVTRAAAYAWQSGAGDRARALTARTEDTALTGVLALRAGNAAEAFDALLTATVREAGEEGRGAEASGAASTGEAYGVPAGPYGGEANCAGFGRGTTTTPSTPRPTATDATSAPADTAEASRSAGAPVASRCAEAGVASRPADVPVASHPPDATASARPAQATAPPRPTHTTAPPRLTHTTAPPRPTRTPFDVPTHAPLDVPASARHLLARATEAAIYTGDLRRFREADRVARRLGIEVPGTLGGLAAASEGRYEDARDLLGATAGRCGPGGDPTLLIHAGIAALLLGDHTRATAATVRAAASARVRGATVNVVQAMEFRAYADFWSGRPRAGEAAAADALWQAYVTGQDNGACHLQAALAMFAALTGDADVCRERAATARSYALGRGLGLPAALAQWALACLDLSSGRFAAAAARLRALAGFGPGHGHRAIRHLATPHYVEAAVRTDDTRVARAAHADYHRWASAVRSPDDLALSARCRALLAPGAEAVDHYRTALDLHARGTRDFERARTELLFGSALRRLRRRTEARDRLHSALEAFEHFGAPHCAAQARAELRALGTPATPAATAPDDPASRLTAQQSMVARMAAEGATNREIATRLALSPRTIDHHLRGVFNRLGIRSRIELVRLLPELEGEGR